MSDSPTSIELPHTRVICGRHGEPFRDEWPKGYALFCVNGLKAVMEDESFQRESGGNVDLVNNLLDVRPICCRLTESKLIGLYRDCGIGHPMVCEGCGTEAQCTPIRDMNFWGRVRRVVRLCFQCTVQKLKSAGRG